MPYKNEKFDFLKIAGVYVVTEGGHEVKRTEECNAEYDPNGEYALIPFDCKPGGENWPPEAVWVASNPHGHGGAYTGKPGDRFWMCPAR